MILALDPGTTHTAWLVLDDVTGKPSQHGYNENAEIVDTFDLGSRIVCEGIASYGMAVGKETFETCYWIGEFRCAARMLDRPFRLVTRPDVKLHLCKTTRAKDTNVRQALIDRFGPVGTKKNPGPLYGIKSHIWSALAVAVWAYDNPQ